MDKTATTNAVWQVCCEVVSGEVIFWFYTTYENWTKKKKKSVQATEKIIL